MTLKTTVLDDIKTAMKARDTARLNTLRLLSADIKRREVDTQSELDDATVLSIIEKACKQRKESIAQFTTAARMDLVEQEQLELDIISAYLPAQMSDDDISTAVTAAVASTGAAAVSDMGKVMAVLKSQLAGKADMSRVSALIKAALSPK
ncbi:MAG: GatB/YqeY domain-containing protein [Formosimonas sp.]